MRLKGWKFLKTYNVNTTFQVRTEFDSMSDKEIMEEHIRIVSLEDSMKNILLIVQFSRGMLYLEINRRLQKDKLSLKNFVEQGLLGVAYTTVLRYMTLASIISVYPRLIICELSFSQILKHKTRLFSFLNKHEGQSLGDKLSTPITITVNGTTIAIQHKDIEMPKLKFNTDPDWLHRDAYEQEDVSDEALQKWAETSKYVDEEEDLVNFMNDLETPEGKKK